MEALAKILVSFMFATTVVAADVGSSYGGTGPFKSYYFEVESLPNHTFFQPLESGVGSDLRLPVIVWGNGGCIPSMFVDQTVRDETVGLTFRAFLGEVASHGALVIAIGPAYVGTPISVAPPMHSSNATLGQNPGALTAAIDWVHANAGKADWKHIDASRIGAWGQSCGGLEAYTAGLNDSRVGHIGIFNSGELDEAASEAVAGNLTKPVFYILGGPTDITYQNGERDYTGLPPETPAWKGNHDLGHIAAFAAPNGGIPGIVGSQIMGWVLRGNASIKAWFTGDSPKMIGFKDVACKNLDSIEVTPIQ